MFAQAERAYGGYWMVDDHMAEALAAAGRYDEAVVRYRAAIVRSPRPELRHALGDLYLYMGKIESAKPWLERARSVYVDSVERGDSHYLHHLARYYSDSRLDAAKAVALAGRDLGLRQTAATYDMLAWALYRDGQFDAARTAVERALASGVRDADIWLHAAMIYVALGRLKEGRHWLHEAVTLNPNVRAFHVHR
jgi:tetratricopeptide (TPR) repeat protein